MMQVRDIAALLGSANAIRNTLVADKVVWKRILDCTMLSSKAAIKNLRDQIVLMQNEDIRFAHLKKGESETNLVTRQLIEDWICQRRRLGLSLSKAIQQCKGFIATGDPRQEAKPVPPPAKEESGGGLFSTIGGLFGMGAAKVPVPVKEEDPVVVLYEIAASERDTTPETIYQALMNAAKKATKQKESFNEWLKALQMMFGTLFIASLGFFREAQEVEKLKDFLTQRLEKLKNENITLKQSNKEMQTQLTEHESVPTLTRSS
jgi:hypothetical protein